MVHKTFDMKYIAYFQSWVQFDFRKYKIQICHNGDFTEKNIIYYSPFDFYKSSDKNS